MTDVAPHPVLQTIIRSAVEVTGAATGWIVGVENGGLRLVAAADPGGCNRLGDVVELSDGPAGYVVASGQPQAITAKGGQATIDSVSRLLGRAPATVLCVPCSDDDVVVGALELVDRGAGAFTFDDVELATLLAGIAGVVLTYGESGTEVRGPSELGSDLAVLARSDPTRYASVAVALDAMLGRE